MVETRRAGTAQAIRRILEILVRGTRGPQTRIDSRLEPGYKWPHDTSGPRRSVFTCEPNVGCRANGGIIKSAILERRGTHVD